MPRIAEPRTPAAPTTPNQHARRERILAAAARLGASKELDRVQMQEVAGEANVALSTLYRYFPSKTHLFVATMAAQVDRLVEAQEGVDWSATPPDEAVFEVLRGAGRALLARRTLAVAMTQSFNAADPSVVTDIDVIDRRMTDLLLDVAGVERATAHQRTLARLVLQSWSGVIQSALNGRVPIEDAEQDLRLACQLLLAPLTGEADQPATFAASASVSRAQV